jgi:AbrB family looped-hinge helix DNA binding protein
MIDRFKHDFKLLGIGKVGPKGQVVVPTKAREELGIKPGDSVVVIGFPHQKAVMVVNEKVFEQHMSHVRRHFDFFDEYESLKNHQTDEFDD